MNCAKHPTKVLSRKNVATKFEPLGKHIQILEEKVALCCPTCGVVAFDEKQKQTVAPNTIYWGNTGVGRGWS